jgi:DNA-binding transcriptional MocR family regulator
VGVLLSQSKRLLAALDNISVFSGCSGHTQAALAAVLSDTALVDTYLQENSRRLARSYDVLARWLQRVGLPFVPATAGIFCWVDFRRVLSAPTFEAENEWFLAMKGAGVILTPGQSQHASLPGFFRVCYAFRALDVLEEALRRIEGIMPPTM